jgi:hypothetical protein
MTPQPSSTTMTRFTLALPRPARWWTAALVLALLVSAGPLRAQDDPTPSDEPAPQEQPAPGVAEPNRWQYLLIHHSASPSGNAASFDRMHRAKGWDGVAYHFVIDNGHGGPDGRLEVTSRWWQQKHGAHAGGLTNAADSEERNCYNEFGIGICLVGNLDAHPPTARQLRTLTALIERLRARFDIPAENIMGHRHVRQTACPGRHFPWTRLFALLKLPPPAFHVTAATPTLERCPWCQAHESVPVLAPDTTASARHTPALPPTELLPADARR